MVVLLVAECHCFVFACIQDAFDLAAELSSTPKVQLR